MATSAALKKSRQVSNIHRVGRGEQPVATAKPTIDRGIPIPTDGATWADSRTERFIKLDVGECESFVKQLVQPAGASFDDAITDGTRAMHNTLASAAARAGKREGCKFSVNVTAQLIQSPWRIVILGVVTRVTL